MRATAETSSTEAKLSSDRFFFSFAVLGILLGYYVFFLIFSRLQSKELLLLRLLCRENPGYQFLMA